MGRTLPSAQAASKLPCGACGIRGSHSRTAGRAWKDVRQPQERIGAALIELAGFQFHEADTAIRQIERLGRDPGEVRHIVLIHGDPDHVGGLADFPQAKVHLSAEEHASIQAGSWRYLPGQFAHGPDWAIHPAAPRIWFGLEARTIALGADAEVLLIPLFGHTLGHCGVAMRQGERWLLHVGDAYYLRVELSGDDHPVSALAAQRADDNVRRLASLEQLRRLVRDHAGEIELFGYHDPGEFPG